MMLRTRLALTLTAVTAVGLLVAGVATATLLRASLIDRIDEQFRTVAGPISGLLTGPFGAAPEGPGFGPGGEGQGRGPGVPPGAYAGRFDASGAVLNQTIATQYGDPALPALNEEILSAAAGGAPVDVPSSGGGPGFRVLVMPTSDGGYLAIGLSLADVSATLTRLLVIEVIVALAVLGAVAGLSVWTVRRSLRPLEEIQATAGAIAAGDLTQRIPDADPATEVGQLGASLNTMLQQIETAMEEQRASEAALRRFLADASHELRTPLTSIRGYAELFRRGAGEDPADTEVAMRRIEQEGERMGLLVDDLLFLARSGEDRPIERVPVDLAAIAADAVADARAMRPERTVTLRAQDAVVVPGDERRLRQVAANLVSNALVHTDAHVHVSVGIEGDDATLTVEDDGPGIPPEHAPHVFEPFYRADAARGRPSERPAEGTGLGLAIVAAIADAHGGSVTLTGDQGSRFTLRLPLREPAPPTAGG